MDYLDAVDTTSPIIFFGIALMLLPDMLMLWVLYKTDVALHPEYRKIFQLSALNFYMIVSYNLFSTVSYNYAYLHILALFLMHTMYLMYMIIDGIIYKFQHNLFVNMVFCSVLFVFSGNLLIKLNMMGLADEKFEREQLEKYGSFMYFLINITLLYVMKKYNRSDSFGEYVLKIQMVMVHVLLWSPFWIGVIFNFSDQKSTIALTFLTGFIKLVLLFAQDANFQEACNQVVFNEAPEDVVFYDSPVSRFQLERDVRLEDVKNN